MAQQYESFVYKVSSWVIEGGKFLNKMWRCVAEKV